MESNGKNAGATAMTPSKSKQKQSIKSKLPENVNPNITSPNSKPSDSPSIKSATKNHESAMKKPNPIKSQSPIKNKLRERKFLVVKKKLKTLDPVNCKCDTNKSNTKCLCVAYDTLRASQDEFFKNQDIESDNVVKGVDGEEALETSGEKRRREKVMEGIRQSVPESGRVMHLVKAFENKLTLPKSDDDNDGEKELKEEEVDEGRKISDSKWDYSSSFCASDLLLTAENLGLRGSRVSSSLDSNNRRILGGGRQTRRNSSESTSSFGGRRWKRTARATTQQPFKLRTEQRGKEKQEEFLKKVQEMMIEEEKKRIPLAQGLPFTTDEPECLVKPPVKESTKPIDLVLHSDVRAVERTEFDHQVQEKLSLIEQNKLERERQQKMEEEEELRRLRKELVPKAQPMPYFDRPFMPRRSEKQPTIPKEPKFHNLQHKKIKCCISLSEMYTQCHMQQ